MAGKGAAPSEQTRQPRRRSTEKFEELPSEGYRGPFPPLPDSYRLERIVMVKDPETKRRVPEVIESDVEFLPATIEWYETWARSPMAVEFTGVHWKRLQSVAKIQDQFERRPDPKLLAELRLQEAGFGGTPLDLRRLGRKIAPGATGPAPATSKRTSSRRRRLSAVPDPKS